MFNKTTVVHHRFTGGWAPDFGPSVYAAVDNNNVCEIPYLLEAQDLIYELDGGPHKIGGTTKGNSSAVASGAAVTGVYDYWRQGVAGSPVRRRVLHAGTVCMADVDDFNYTNLFTGLTSGAVPSYCTFDDLLIISSDATSDVPRSWDQTTAQNLAGSPPRFSFCVAHKNRAWAAGNFSAPSRLYYCVNNDPEDWTGSGSGSIDIDINDGDIITGLVSHKNDLWVFKGPNKGSIHRITGSSPTGSDGFARVVFSRGLGACWHNAIFRFADDIGFVSQFGSVHSLSATASYGDFLEASLSRGFNNWLREHLNYNRLRYISAANHPQEGRVYITASIDANSTNNIVAIMDYRAAPNMRWSYVPSYRCASLGLFVDTSGLRRILAGGNDGFVRRLNIADRSIDNTTALSFIVTAPYLNYGNSMLTKTINAASLGLAPRGNYNATFSWAADNLAAQSQTVAQGGADVLGPATAHEFTLGTSILGGGIFSDRFMELETGGEFRSVQYKVTQTGLNEDIELHNISALITPGAISTEN